MITFLLEERPKLFSYKSLIKAFSLLSILSVLSLMGCQTAILKDMPTRSQGLTVHGDNAKIFTLSNNKGMVAELSNFGASVVRLNVPDRNGNFKDVVLGFNTLKEYEKNSDYFGAVTGRYSGRIGEGKFRLDEATYFLNNNSETAGFPSHLNGGNQGFDKVIWDAVPMSKFNATGMQFTHISPDGHEGYPGNVEMTVTYWLTDENELIINYSATSDESTVLNPSSHIYFNLKGEGRGDILDHMIKIEGDHYTPVELSLLPRGEIVSVYGTPFNFKQAKRIGATITEDHPQLKYADGYNHNWVLMEDKTGLKRAATVYEPESGRYLEVLTTEPGLNFYSGQNLDGSLLGKGGGVYDKHSGFVLVPQHFPDSPNRENFPSTRVNPGDTYKSQTIFRFRTR